MATIQQIQSALDSLNGGGGINKDSLIKTILKKNLEASYETNLSEEQMDKMVEDLKSEANSPYYLSISNSIDKINSALETIPDLVASLSTQIATIPGTVIGMAAPAAAPMVLSVKSQATSLKHILSDVLASAVSLGVEIPGIDPLITAISTLKPLL